MYWSVNKEKSRTQETYATRHLEIPVAEISAIYINTTDIISDHKKWRFLTDTLNIILRLFVLISNKPL